MNEIDQDVTLNRQITYYFRFTIAPVEMNWNEIKPTRRIFFSFFYFFGYFVLGLVEHFDVVFPSLQSK